LLQLKKSKLAMVFCAAVLIMIGLTVLLMGCSNAATAQPNSSVIPMSQASPSEEAPSVNPTTIATVIQSTTPVQTLTQTIPTVTPVTPTALQIADRNIIVDHTNWDQYNSQPKSVFENVAKLKVFFAHASVGANILQGLQDLNDADRLKYPISQESVDGTPPATTVDGNIYEYNRGNPSWSEKISSFETYLKNGWNEPKVNIVMNKFCYIDPTADWTAYRDSMTGLEAQYPGTKFIYWTMPLTTNSDSDQVLRSQFNHNLRNWITTQKNKILFDLADIEAWTPDRQHQTFTSKSTTYEQMYSGYSSDGGHLNTDGMIRAAIGFYSLLGEITNLKP
jgi:hypothetical protein